MTRRAYMYRLEKGLESLNKKFANDILNDYEIHFQNGLNMGKSEEEICRELGDVDQLIKECKEMAATHPGYDQTEIEVHRDLPEVSSDDAVSDDNQAALDHKVSDDQAEDEKKSFFENGRDRQWENDEKFQGYSGEMKDDCLAEGRSVRQFSFSGAELDTKVIVSEDRQLKVYLMGEGSREFELETYFQGESYYVQVKRKRKGFWAFLAMSDAKVIIEIPGGFNLAQIKTVSGDLEVQDVSVSTLSLGTTSGDLAAVNIFGSNLEMNTVSGDLALNNIHMDYIYLKSVSGDISGKRMCSAKIASESVSGDVGMSKTFFRKGKFTTKSGDIRIRLERQGRDFVAKTRTISGDVRVKGDVDAIDLQQKNIDFSQCIQVQAGSISGDISVS